MKYPPDPGLQAERTTLAWQRTAMSAGVVAVLAFRSAWVSESAVTLLTVAGLAALPVATLRRGRVTDLRTLIKMTATTVTVVGALVTASLLIHY